MKIPFAFMHHILTIRMEPVILFTSLALTVVPKIFRFMSTCVLEDLFRRSSSRIGLSLKELQASALTLISMDFQQRESLFYFIQAKNTEDINTLLQAIGQEDFMERQA